MKRVIVHKKTRILDDFFKVEEAFVSYQRFDGRMSPAVRRLNFERNDAVAAIVFNRETHKVILVNQFKYPTYEKGPGWITEAVAGILEKNETPEEAIRREVLEEIGYEVAQLQPISAFYASPGGSSERIFLYYAEVVTEGKVRPGGGVAAEDEDIQIVELSVSQVQEELASGHIPDAKTIIGIIWLQKHLEAAGSGNR